MVRLGVRSWWAIFLAAALGLSGFSTGVSGLLPAGSASAKALLAEAPIEPRPVVIIDGASLGRYLESVGYTRGKNLFEIRLDGLDDLESGAMQISEAVTEVLSGVVPGKTGEKTECDIVAAGLPGLIARYALEKGYMSDVHVVNLVMAASPNRGTFLAGVVKSALELVRQESILERETRLQRFLPSLKDLFGEVDAPVSLKELTGAKSLRPPEWEDEASWISTRSTTLWEPLYAEYVKNRFFALPYVPADSPKETFAGWVRRTLPDVWKRLIVEAEWPLSNGQRLSLPYYEILAMEVARNQYVMRAASKRSLVSSLFKDPVIPKDWKEAAIQYGTKLLLHFAEKALITLKAHLQELIANEAVKLLGLGSGPDSPLIAGLVKEDIIINLGTSSSKRFERIPANLALEGLNRLSQSAAHRRDTRYVSVLSKLANPWALIWPELGPNDSLLEVDCGVAPTGTKDLIAVIGGILRLPGKHVLDDRKAQEYVREVLLEDIGSESKAADGTGKAGEPGKQEVPSLSATYVSSWRPVFSPVDGMSKVTLGITELPSGWQCQVWEESRDPHARGREAGRYVQGVMWGFDRGGTYVLNLTPGTVRLGFRLVRSGPLNPVVGNTVTSAFAQEVLVRVFVSPSGEKTPEAGEGPAPPGAEAPLEPEGPPGTPESPGQGGPSEPPTGVLPPAESPGGGHGTADPPGLHPWWEETDLPDDLPIVRVVYRSKHTTLKKPKETVHDHWVLDYGDGSGETVQGQVSLSVDHTFQSPGNYAVIAESYTGEGKLLYRKTWLVSPVLSGETHRFECESVSPVNVDIVLTGPEKWVTGRVAVFSVGAKIDLPSNAELVSVRFDPGEMFGVIWERAGDFVVGAAASIIVKYSLEDACIQIENVFLKEVPVTVLTTGVTM